MLWVRVPFSAQEVKIEIIIIKKTKNMMLYVILILWILGGLFTYNFLIKKWNKTKIEKIWFSGVWPVTLLLYLINLFTANA